MYKWFSVRIKNRLGLSYAPAELDYLQIEKVRTFPGLRNVARERELGTFTTLRDRKLYFRLHGHSDTYVLEQVFVNRDYEPVIMAYRENFAGTGEIRIIDAGANVGYTSVYFLQSIPDAKIVCIEPDAGNTRLLTQNLGGEIECGSVVLLASALMDRPGLNIVTGNDFRDGKDWAISVLHSENESELKSVSIPEIMASMKWDDVDILKIDIEGAERFVFQEDADVEWLEKVKLLALEIHDEFDIRESIYKTLERYGFNFADFGETTIAINRRLSRNGGIN